MTFFLEAWTQAVVATVCTSKRPAAACATWGGKVKTAPCPPVLTSATITGGVWTAGACVTRATQGTTATS